MNLTYSIYLGPRFQFWVTEHLALLNELYTPEVEALFETFEDWAVELYLTIKAGE